MSVHPELSNKLSRQQSAALLNIPCVSPGTWLTTPCLNPLNRFNHHFIAIHPLLYCGYNGREINMVNLWGDISTGQEKKYITKTWKIVREPKSAQHAALIITRAISRLGEQKYKGLSNNCEHYATWCFTGYSSSKQVYESVLNGLSSGGAALAGAGIGAMSVPTVGIFSSAQIGAAGVVIGSVTAAVSWPFILTGAVVGCAVGYGIPKGMELNRKHKYRKKLRQKLVQRENHYSVEMMDEVAIIIEEIDEIGKDVDIDKSDLEEVSIALNDIFMVLDKYYHRDIAKKDVIGTVFEEKEEDDVKKETE